MHNRLVKIQHEQRFHNQKRNNKVSSHFNRDFINKPTLPFDHVIMILEKYEEIMQTIISFNSLVISIQFG